MSDFVSSYNSTLHRSINMKPRKVNDENQWIAFKNQYLTPLIRKEKKQKRKGKIYPKFKLGDNVRLSKLKTKFPSKYGSNWTNELFTISQISFRDGIPIFRVKDWKNKLIEGMFYSNELNKASPKEDDLYKVDEI